MVTGEQGLFRHNHKVRTRRQPRFFATINKIAKGVNQQDRASLLHFKCHIFKHLVLELHRSSC